LLRASSTPCLYSFGEIAHATNIEIDDSELLVFEGGGILDLPDGGFPYYRMEKAVPAKGIIYAQETLKQLFAKPAPPIRQMEDASAYFIHTGSKKILDRICETFAIDPMGNAVKLSYEIFDRYANLSACSVGFMIEKQMRQFPRGSEPASQNVGLLLSFGAGFTASSGFIYL
jgi:predicted naringenin-chalcone synthase